MAAATQDSNCSYKIPSAEDYLKDMDSGELAVVSVCFVMTVATVLLYAEEIFHMRTRFFTDSEAERAGGPKRKQLALLGLYPILSFNSTLTLLMPRAAGFADLTMALYEALCMFIFSQTIFKYFGGKANLVKKLHGSTIQLRGPPCCCLFFCLPRPSLTMLRVHMIEFCVLQYVLLKPLTLYLISLMFIDSGSFEIFGNANGRRTTYQITDALTTFSTLLAVYGNTLLFRLVVTELHRENIRAKFILLQGTITLEIIQRFLVMTLISSLHVFGEHCEQGLPTTSTALRFHHVLLTIEVMFLSVAARIYYRDDIILDVLRSTRLNSPRHMSQGSIRSYDSTNTTATALESPVSNELQPEPVNTINTNYGFMITDAAHANPSSDV